MAEPEAARQRLARRGNEAMGRFSRSFALAKASWQVLLSEKEMMVYTALGALLTAVAAAVFAVPGILMVTSGGGPRSTASLTSSPGGIALLFITYLVISFITLFFNTALVGAALNKLRGGETNLSQGFQIATSNLPHIFIYALISATVGVVLAVIEDEFKAAGEIAAAIFGGAWAIVTFLVVPVMVAENVNPFSAIKRSGQLLRKTWGEQIIGSGGIGLVVFLFALVAVIPVVLGFLSGITAGLIAGLVIAAVYLAVVFLVGSALGSIFRAAVYLYAETGETPTVFRGMLQDAFKPKKGSTLTGNA
jgi:Family of unknown function (DUF6159)